MFNKPVISIIICTYNRAALLKNCLQSLEKQTTDKKNYEVIVVNNNSNDNTREIIKNFVKGRLNIRTVTEKKQGLSYARNLGWQEAKGKYVGYIDDDALAEPDWVEEIIMFIKNNPKINAFGGPYDRFSIKPFPDWFPESCGISYSGDRVKVFKNESLSGSNMIFNKLVFEKYGGFKTNLGMKGDRILYGEETEFLVRLGRMGELVYYVPTIRIKHLVDERKLNLLWLLKNDYFSSFSYSLLKRSISDLLRGLVYFIMSLLMLPYCLFNNKKNPFKRKVYFGLSGIISSLGRIIGSIRGVK